MGVLSNSKYELFAQSRAQGASAAEAYVAAGYKANTGNAARMNAIESVRARIEEIQSEGAAKAGLTIEWVLAGLKGNYERATQTDDGTVANKALELIGKHLGMFKDRVEHAGPGGDPLDLTTKIIFVDAGNQSP